MGKIRESLQQLAQLEISRSGERFELLGLFLQCGRLRSDKRNVAALALQSSELRRQCVALGLERLRLGDCRTTLRVEGGESAEERQVRTAETEFFFNQREIGPHKS